MEFEVTKNINNTYVYIYTHIYICIYTYGYVIINYFDSSWEEERGSNLTAGSVGVNPDHQMCWGRKVGTGGGKNGTAMGEKQNSNGNQRPQQETAH